MRLRTYLPEKYKKLFKRYREYVEQKKGEEISKYKLVQLMIITTLKEWSAEASVGPA